MRYSIQLKEAVLKKVLQGNKPHHEIAKELGVGRSTIGKWLREYKQNGSIKLLEVLQIGSQVDVLTGEPKLFSDHTTVGFDGSRGKD